MRRHALTIAAAFGLAASLGTAGDAAASDLEFVVYSGDAYVRYVHDDRQHRYDRRWRENRNRHYRLHRESWTAHDWWHWQNDGRRDRFYERDHWRFHQHLRHRHRDFHRHKDWHRYEYRYR